MSYAIAEAIYGVPLVSKDLGDPQVPQIIEEAIEDELEGILTYYSGSADETPAAFGVDLRYGFDECSGYLEMSDVNPTVTEEQKEELNKLLNNLDEDLRKAILEYGGTPRVFFLWSTS